MSTGARRSIYAFASDQALSRAAAALIGTYVLEGPLRFLLVQLQLEMLLYTRDALALTIVLVAIATWLRGERSCFPLIAACGVVLAHALVGALSLPSLLQPLMGMKILLPLLLGIVLAPLILREPARFARFAVGVFVLTASGVLLNLFLPYPWVGLAYDTAFTSVEVSRSWTSGGALRLPGFTRASFSAASITLASLVPCLAISRSRLRDIALLSMCGTTVYLTTTKGAWTGLLVFTSLELIILIAGVRAWIVAICTIACVCSLLPLVSVLTPIGATEVPDWQLSFVARMREMWPNAFALLDTPAQAVWGRGVGGIGMAQTFGEWQSVNAADNLMVYVLLTYGLFGISYLAAFIYRACTFVALRRRSALDGRLVRGWLAVWLSFGITTNMLEDTSMEIAVGIAMGVVFRMGIRRSSSPLLTHVKLDLIDRQDPRQVALEKLDGEPAAVQQPV